MRHVINLDKETREKRKALKKAEAEAIERARAAWITEHGSEHLKRAWAAGYYCTHRFYTEYAARKYPDAILDFNEHAEIAKRSYPTVKALNLRDKLLNKRYVAKIEIVWLKNFPLNEVSNFYDREQEFEPCEAIMITDPVFRIYKLFIEVKND